MNRTVDTLFWKWTLRFMDIILMGTLWLITSLPIITIGASSTTLNMLMGRYVAGIKVNILKDYFHEFKKCFKKATIIWLIHLIVFLLLALDLIYYWTGNSTFDALGAAVLATLLTLIIFEFNMVFIILSRKVHAKVKEIISEAFDLSMTCFLQALCIAILTIGLPISAFFLMPELLVMIPGIICYLNWQILPKMFEKYMAKKTDREYQKKNRQNNN